MNNQNYYQDNMQPMYGSNQFTGYPPRNQPVSRFRGPQPVQTPYYNQFVPTSNKQFVDSLEHALSLPADYNS